MTYLLVCIHLTDQQRGILHVFTLWVKNLLKCANLFFVWIHCTNTSFLHSLQPSPVCAVTEICCNALLINFRWENQRMGYFTSNKEALQSHVSRLFFYDFYSITAWLSPQRQLAASHVLSSACCIFAALKQCDVQSTAGGPSITVTMLPPPQSLLPFSKFICKQLSDWHSYLYQVKRCIKFWI